MAQGWEAPRTDHAGAPSTARPAADMLRVTDMSSRTATRVAWGTGVLCAALLASSLVFLALDSRAIDSVGTAQLAWYLNVGIAGVLGVLITTRRPRNPIGWLLLAIAASNASYLLGNFIAIHALLAGTSPRSWVEWPAWLTSVGGSNNLLLAFLVLFFPDGRLPGRRWRPVAGVMVVLAAVLTFQNMLSPSELSPRLPVVPEPLGVAAAGLTAYVGPNGVLNLPAIALFLLLLVITVVVRFRRSTGVARKQLEWFALVAATASSPGTAWARGRSRPTTPTTSAATSTAASRTSASCSPGRR